MSTEMIRIQFPQTSLLYQTSYHYSDSYSGEFEDRDELVSSVDIGRAFFGSAPKWSQLLFRLRNKIVSFLGLKTSDEYEDPAEILNKFKCEPNERVGLFKVFEKTDNEVILGEDDTHLGFRISLLLSKNMRKQKKRQVTITTTVHYNNRLGRLYFMIVKPFHKLIVANMLAGTLKKIDSLHS